MAIQKKPIKFKQIKTDILKEINFIKNVFRYYTPPNHSKGKFKFYISRYILSLWILKVLKK